MANEIDPTRNAYFTDYQIGVTAWFGNPHEEPFVDLKISGLRVEDGTGGVAPAFTAQDICDLAEIIGQFFVDKMAVPEASVGVSEDVPNTATSTVQSSA